MTAGALTVTSSISGAAALSAHSLAIQDGATITGSSVNHGSLTLHGVLSSSANITLPSDSYVSSSGGATFLQGIIANTLEASSSISAAGNLQVSGNMSSSAIVKGHQLAIQSGFQVTGSSILHGPMKIENGNISCSVGASFLGTVIANTIEASSSIMTAGALTVTGAISGAAALSAHSLAIQDGAVVTGSTTLHGPMSSSYGGTFTQGLITVRTLEATGSVTTQGDLNTSGAVNVAGAGTVVGPLTTRDNLNVSGSTVLGNAAADTINITGSTKVHGPISSSYGATFLGGIITDTIEATGSVTVNTRAANATGGGFDGAAGVTMYVSEINGEIVTTILVDIEDLLVSGTENDIIGEDDVAAAYITQITTAVNGIIYKAEMSCIEVPAGSNTTADIDLVSNAASLAEDADGTAGTALTLITANGAYTAGMTQSTGPDDLSALVDDYLYLTNGSGANSGGTYTAGKFVIKLYGANF